MMREKFFKGEGFGTVPALWRRFAVCEGKTGLSLDRGLTREEYIRFFTAMDFRHLGDFTGAKTALRRYLTFLTEQEALAPQSLREMESVYFRDLGLGREQTAYYSDVTALREAVEQALSGGTADVSCYDGAVSALYAAWAGFRGAEICTIKKADIQPGGILREGRLCPLPDFAVEVLTRYRDAEGYVQQARGTVFHRYQPSEYLFRTERSARTTKARLANQVSRLGRLGEGGRPLTLHGVYVSGLFHRLYVAECVDRTLDLETADTAALSAAFREDLSAPQKRMTRLAEYRRYKGLFQPETAVKRRRLRVQTFGNFGVFRDGVPVRFRRTRTKELFAYLIDRRGAGCTMGELISVLWEGRPDTGGVRSQLRSLIADLRGTLEALGEEAVVIKQRNLIAVDPEQVDCDYYRFLAGDRGAVNAFRGEYMANYSWAEPTVGALERSR